MIDEDLSAMYLTARAIGKPRALHDHEQLELLLESFVKQVEEIESEVDNTVVSDLQRDEQLIARQTYNRHKRLQSSCSIQEETPCWLWMSRFRSLH